MLKTGDYRIASITIAAFLFFPVTQSGFLYTFHESCFAPVILFSLFYFLETEKKLYFWIFVLCALGIKENVCIPLIGLGLFIIFEKNKFSQGIILIIISIAWLLISTKYIIPFFKGSDYSFADQRFSHFINPDRKGLAGIFLNILERPINTLVYIFTNNEKILFLCLLILPLFFLPFKKLTTSALLIFSLAEPLLSNYSPQYTLGNYYAYLQGPFIFYAYLNYLFSVSNENKFSVALTVLFSCFLFNYFFGQFSTEFNAQADHKKFEKFIDITNIIEPEGAVSTQTHLGGILSNRKTILLFLKNYRQAEYILLDTSAGYWCAFADCKKENAKDEISSIIKSNEFGFIKSSGDFILLKKDQKSLFSVPSLEYKLGYKTFTHNTFYPPVLKTNLVPDSKAITDSLVYIKSDTSSVSNNLNEIIIKTDSITPGKYSFKARLKINKSTSGVPLFYYSINDTETNKIIREQNLSAVDFGEKNRLQTFRLNFEISHTILKPAIKIHSTRAEDIWIDCFIIEPE